MGFPDRLRQARIGMGLTQKDLSEKIGVANSAISNYEKGTSFPNVEILYKLFTTLNVDPNFLFQDETNVNNEVLSAEELQIIGYYRGLNDTGKQKANNYILDLVRIPEYQKSSEKVESIEERQRKAIEEYKESLKYEKAAFGSGVQSAKPNNLTPEQVKELIRQAQEDQ